MQNQEGSTCHGSITRLLRKLPQGNEEVIQDLFKFYLGQVVAVSKQRLRGANRRVSDEEDLAAEVLTSFLMAGAQGDLPELSSREDALRMLWDRVGKRAINQQRDAARQKRGGGKVRGESAFERPDGGTDTDGIQQAADSATQPDARLLLEEDLQELNAKLIDCLGAPVAEVAELWLQGQSAEEIAGILGLSRATVYRKLTLIRDRLSTQFPMGSGSS